MEFPLERLGDFLGKPLLLGTGEVFSILLADAFGYLGYLAAGWFLAFLGGVDHTEESLLGFRFGWHVVLLSVAAFFSSAIEVVFVVGEGVLAAFFLVAVGELLELLEDLGW